MSIVLALEAMNLPSVRIETSSLLCVICHFQLGLLQCAPCRANLADHWDTATAAEHGCLQVGHREDITITVQRLH